MNDFFKVVKESIIELYELYYDLNKRLKSLERPTGYTKTGSFIKMLESFPQQATKNNI